MIIGAPKEIYPGEKRAALEPTSVEKLVKKGAEVVVESGIGATIYLSDEDYKKAGATVADRASVLSSADITLRVRKPPVEEISQFKKGSIHISFLDPFNETETVNELAKNEISTISMGMIPRTTLAQKMDALSSQANLAGYVAVVLAAERLDKILPMMMTPAGTIPPARVFIVGAGVAGLQAIATARRLGARVEAFDTRPVVEEEVQSLGAKFVKIKKVATGQNKDGYAEALTDEQIEQQRQGMKKVCSHSDIIITTAQLFGRKAPVIITKDMIDQMKPGSIIVDMAVESGGNVEGAQLDEKVVTDNGVLIIGLGNMPSRVCVHATHMYSSNLTNLITSFWNDEQKTFDLNTENEIIKGCLLTHKGEIVHEMLKNKG